MSRGRAFLFSLTALVLLGGVWLVLHVVRGETSGPGSESPSSASPREWKAELVRRGVKALKEGEAKGLAPLGASHGAAEPVPLPMQRKLRRNLYGKGSLGLRLDRAQRVQTPAGVAFWIVEGRGVTCIFLDEASSSCKTSVEARKTGVFLETYRITKAHPGRPSHFLVVGAMPRRRPRDAGGGGALEEDSPGSRKRLVGARGIADQLWSGDSLISDA